MSPRSAEALAVTQFPTRDEAAPALARAAIPNRTALAPTLLVDELARAGVRDVCVSPGSRSAPLVSALVAHGGLRLWSHVDERSGGFFALGLARASRTPVAIVCTSGTAVANLFPAVVEAFHARVPLVVLTADRPPELRDCGAGQTIDQLGIFGSHVRWFCELGTPDATLAAMRHVRAVACRAVATARGETGSVPGPVHVNLPFRDPLDPRPVPGDVADALLAAPAGRGRDGAPWTQVGRARATVESEALPVVIARAQVHLQRGDLAAARAAGEQALALAAGAGLEQHHDVAAGLELLAAVARRAGDAAAALPLLTEAQAIARRRCGDDSRRAQRLAALLQEVARA